MLEEPYLQKIELIFDNFRRWHGAGKIEGRVSMYPTRNLLDLLGHTNNIPRMEDRAMILFKRYPSLMEALGGPHAWTIYQVLLERSKANDEKLPS